MGRYYYKAKNNRSEVIEAEVSAESKVQVVQQLVGQKLTPIVIREVVKRQGVTLFSMGKPRIRKSELLIFTRQLASILKAGISMLDSLELLEKQMPKSASAIVSRVRSDIQGGQSLSDSLAKHPAAFNEMYVNMVRIGESGGILTDILDRMATMFEYAEENRQKVKSALRYPKIVFFIMALVFITIVTVIVPKFSGIFSSLKAQLPLPTRILIGANDAIVGYWYIVMPIFIVGYFLYRRWSKGSGRRLVDWARLRVPIFGSLQLKSEIARFARFFGSLYKSGVPISESLRMAAGISENVLVSSLIEDMRKSVIHGSGLVSPLRSSKLFPDLVIQMVAIGENTGSIPEMFERLATYYEREVDYTVKNLTALIEPFLIVGLGAMVLLIALGVFLPMWNMMKVIKGSLGG